MHILEGVGSEEEGLPSESEILTIGDNSKSLHN